jgi:hypothetical protein
LPAACPTATTRGRPSNSPQRISEEQLGDAVEIIDGALDLADGAVMG